MEKEKFEFLKNKLNWSNQYNYIKFEGLDPLTQKKLIESMDFINELIQKHKPKI